MSSILEQVRQGMRVCDPDGREIGTVEHVHLSDEDPATPEAETVAVSRDPGDRRFGADAWLAAAFGADDLPVEVRQRLLRHGFLRMDAKGLFAGDRYVMPEQVAAVEGERVVLKVGRDRLVRPG